MHIRRFAVLVSVVLLVLTSCRGGRSQQGDENTCDLLAPACGEGQACELFDSGVSRCVVPVQIRGSVVDISSGAPIADALVQAVDVNGAAVGTSGSSDSDGGFVLTVPAVRDEDETPVAGSYTLRVQAALYQPFPTAIRPALPVDASTAVLEEGGFVIENSLTTVALLALPGDTSNLGSISGQVEGEKRAGVLVVAESGGVGWIGFSDVEGAFTIFNVPPSTYVVSGYAAGVQVNPATTGLASAEEKTGVVLTASDLPLSTVSGQVQIVNAPGGSLTSVVLAVESTFVEAAARGTVPPGLRAGEIDGAFAIPGVPAGNYVVLAAFENDGLVRDPDQTIGGTRIVRIEVPDPILGHDVALSEGFKVTGALAVTSPGSDGPEEIFTPTPTFIWEDDSSEDGYEIRVYDAFGEEIWSGEIDSVSGSATVSHTYAGPTLESGMFYQFRTSSFRERSGVRTAISSTEDLTGVFLYLGAE